MVLRVDKVIERLADDLMDTLVESAGVGLAANQIGSLKRMIALRMPENDEPTIYINPKIMHKEGTREVQEGCLSFPDYYGTVNRSMWVKVTSLDRKSKVMRLRADGLLAQAFEHEIDHLNGILFIDHLLSHEHLFKYESEDEKQIEEAGSLHDESGP
jgi:peptide deformylase